MQHEPWDFINAARTLRLHAHSVQPSQTQNGSKKRQLVSLISGRSKIKVTPFPITLVQHHTYVQVVYIILVKINHLYIKYQIKFLERKLFHQFKNNTIKITFYFTTYFFAQNFKFQGYGQYYMYGSVIDVHANVNQIQSILPHLPHDGATIGVFFK